MTSLQIWRKPLFTPHSPRTPAPLAYNNSLVISRCETPRNDIRQDPHEGWHLFCKQQMDSKAVRYLAIPGMKPMLAQRSATEIIVYHGEAEDRLCFFFGVYRPPLTYDCFALASRYRCA
jgi:hypothetical protein